MRRLCSEGQSQASAYVEVEVPPSRVEPTLDMQRVELLEPSETPEPPHDAPPKSTGPRNPHQTRAPTDKDEPRIELPEGLPLTAAQRVFVPPELAAEWREEARRKGMT